MLVLNGEVVQRLILQHWQINRNICPGFRAELEVDWIHSRIDTKGLLVRHVSWANRMASSVTRCLQLLRAEIVGRRISQWMTAQDLKSTFLLVLSSPIIWHIKPTGCMAFVVASISLSTNFSSSTVGSSILAGIVKNGMELLVRGLRRSCVSLFIGSLRSTIPVVMLAFRELCKES